MWYIYIFIYIYKYVHLCGVLCSTILLEPLSCFTDMRSLVMSDDRTVEEGNSLNVTCWVESYPLSRIRWTKFGSSTELNYEMSTDLENNKISALLLISNVTTEDSGRYSCEAAFLETSVSIYTDIMVTSE